MKGKDLTTAVAALVCLASSSAHAQSQYPILDRVAERVIQKYQTSSCQQLAAERGQRPTGRRAEMEARFI
jgi:hypothetical protein